MSYLNAVQFAKKQVDDIKKQKIAQMITNARQNRLSVKLRKLESLYEDGAERRAANIELSLKVWEVLHVLLDLAVKAFSIGSAWTSATVTVEAMEATEQALGAQLLASGDTNIMEGITAEGIADLAGPLTAWVSMWCELGSPYLGIREHIQKEAAKRGIAHGILIACQGRKTHSASLFANRQPSGVNNRWIDNATFLAQNSYRMGFIAGYVEGHELNEKQNHLFWRIFGESLKDRNETLWNPNWGEKGNDDWIWGAGGIFIDKHLVDD